MLLLGLLLACLSIASAYQDYGSHSILRAVPRSKNQLNVLRNLNEKVEVDFLSDPRSINNPTDIILRSRYVNQTQDFLNKFNIKNFVLENNFESFVQREKRAVLDIADVPISRDMLMTHYLSFDMQMRVMEQLAAAFPGLVRLEKLGTSYEGRPIMAAFIGIPSHFKKPFFWIDAGIHAREWIASATALYTLWEYVTNPEHYDLLRQMEIVIVPNMNPDGYEFSRLSKRLWRKTRSNTTVERCPGVDGNRNYPFHWGNGASSGRVCGETYRGPHAASEPEVQALINAITARKEMIQGYVALHSYSQFILYPWDYAKNTYPDDVEDLKAMAHVIANAIKSVRGTEYKVLNTATGLYPAPGSSNDWAKSIGIKYTYTLELSPDNISKHEFVLPEEYIAQTVTEAFVGLNAMAKKIAQTAFL